MVTTSRRAATALGGAPRPEAWLWLIWDSRTSSRPHDRPASMASMPGWTLVRAICAANADASAAYSRAPGLTPTSGAALYSQAGRPRRCPAARVRTTSPWLDKPSRCSRIVLGCWRINAESAATVHGWGWLIRKLRMASRAVDRCDCRRLSCAVGSGPYPGLWTGFAS